MFVIYSCFNLNSINNYKFTNTNEYLSTKINKTALKKSNMLLKSLNIEKDNEKKEQDTNININYDYNNLKLTGSALGKNTWAFLHSVAANYPEEPSNEHKEAIKKLVEAFKVLYPPEKCRLNFVKKVESERFDITKNYNSKKDLINYFCDIHNSVNQELKKPLFDCSKAGLYWDTSNPTCAKRIK